MGPFCYSLLMTSSPEPHQIGGRRHIPGFFHAHDGLVRCGCSAGFVAQRRSYVTAVRFAVLSEKRVLAEDRSGAVWNPWGARGLRIPESLSRFLQGNFRLLAMYYLQPQRWSTQLSPFASISCTIASALASALVTARISVSDTGVVRISTTMSSFLENSTTAAITLLRTLRTSCAGLRFLI